MTMVRPERKPEKSADETMTRQGDIIDIDRATLLELYRNALEEARHYERLSMQVWMTAPTAFILISGFAYYFGVNIIQAHIVNFLVIWLSASSLGSLFIIGFSVWISFFDESAYISRDIASKLESRIESILAGKMDRAPDIKDLLVMGRTKLLRQGITKVPEYLRTTRDKRRTDRLVGLFLLLLALVIWWLAWWWAFNATNNMVIGTPS